LAVGRGVPRHLTDGSGFAILAILGGMLAKRSIGRSPMMNTVPVVLAVSTGVVVIAVAAAVVLVVLIVAVSMRGRQQRDAQRRGEARRHAERAGPADRDRGDDLGPEP
jgi:hypothetical protein